MQCPALCGTHWSAFPAEVAAQVQYGLTLKAFAILLSQLHMLPFERNVKLLSALFGLSLSPATIETFVIEAAGQLRATAVAIVAGVTLAPVIHVVETDLCWVEGNSSGCTSRWRRRLLQRKGCAHLRQAVAWALIVRVRTGGKSSFCQSHSR